MEFFQNSKKVAWVYLSFTQGWRVLGRKEGARGRGGQARGGGWRAGVAAKAEVGEGSAGSW